MTKEEKQLQRSLAYARKHKKQLCTLPLGNIPAVVIKIVDRLWAPLVWVRPLATNPFYTRNVKREELLHHIKYIE